ncbi:MAG: response regulator [bacterium]|nr:response regulator [bacterium]
MHKNSLLLSIIILITLIVINYYIKKRYRKQQEQVQWKLEQEKKEKERKAKSDKRKRKKEQVEWNQKIQESIKKEKILNSYIPNKKLKVLVGDYYQDSATNTNSILKSVGIETEFVPNEKGIIEKIQNQEHFDLIITNSIYKNGGSGIHVLIELKEHLQCNIPIIVLTVNQNARDYYVNKLGFTEYLSKPLTLRKLIKVLPKVIPGLKFKKEKSNDTQY